MLKDMTYLELLESIWLIATSIVTIASVIVKYTKTTEDDKAVSKLAAILELLALNKRVPTQESREKIK